MEPGSFVLSNTEINFTVLGKTSNKYFATNGRYSLTFTRPTFSPAAVK